MTPPTLCANVLETKKTLDPSDIVSLFPPPAAYPNAAAFVAFAFAFASEPATADVGTPPAELRSFHKSLWISEGRG